MAPQSNPQTFRLAMAEEDATVRVVAIQGSAGFARRVAEMGLNVGCELVVLQRRDPGLVVARGQTRLALDSAMAHNIVVCATAPNGVEP